MLVKDISCDCECKFNGSTCYPNQKWNNDKWQCECKKCRECKKGYSWNLSICTCENSRYSKGIAEISVIACHEIINATDSASTNVTIITSIKVRSNMITNYDDKTVKYKMNFYILHAILLVIILLFIIATICYHYAKHRSKLKNTLPC